MVSNARTSGLLRLLPVLASLLVLVTAGYGVIQEPPAVTALRNTLFDSWQRWSPRVYQPAPVQIIDIDDASLEKRGQWPWPRSVMADLVGRLQDLGAAAIAFDVVFAEPDRSSPAQALAPWHDRPEIATLIGQLPDHDQALAAAIGRGRVVTGFTVTHGPAAGAAPAHPAKLITAGDDPRPFVQPQFSAAVTSLPELTAAAAGNGAFTFLPDQDGVIRHVPLLLHLGNDLYPSLAAEALRVAQGKRNLLLRASGAGDHRAGGQTGLTSVKIGAFEIPTDSGGQVWLHYSPPVAERTIPAWQVLEGQVPAEAIRGAILFVGTSAQGLQDLRFTPLGRVMPGVEAHAQLVEQVLQGTLLNRPELAKAGELLYLLAMWAALGVILSRVGAIWAAAAAVAAILATFAGAWYAFSVWRLLLDPLTPGLAVIGVFLAWSVPRHLAEERRARWIRDAFASYVSPNLVQHLISHPERLTLGGEFRDCTFVMTDLAGFTTLMEKFGPDQVVSLLNSYLTEMIAIAFRHEGTLDRIVGDAVAVMFSAPVTQPDHAARAIACALEMDRFSRAFAAARRAEGIPFGVTRIGVHSGRVLVGNFGGETIFDYRALGDPINTASRLESVNKHLGTLLCISGATVAQCPDFVGRQVGTLVLKGKSAGIEAWEALPPEHAASPEIATYNRAFQCLLAGDLPTATELFATLPEDPLARLHLQRLQKGETTPIIVMSEK